MYTYMYTALADLTQMSTLHNTHVYVRVLSIYKHDRYAWLFLFSGVCPGVHHIT